MLDQEPAVVDRADPVPLAPRCRHTRPAAGHVHLPRHRAARAERDRPADHPGREDRRGRGQRGGQDDAHQAAAALLRPRPGAHHPRRTRHPRRQPVRPPSQRRRRAAGDPRLRRHDRRQHPLGTARRHGPGDRAGRPRRRRPPVRPGPPRRVRHAGRAARSPAVGRPAAAAGHRAGDDPRRPGAAPGRADHGPRRRVERTRPRPAAPADGRPDDVDDLPQPADGDRRRPDRLPRGRPDHRRRHPRRAAGPQPRLRPALPAAPSRRRGAADGHRRPALHGPSSRARLRSARSAAFSGAAIRSRPAAPGRHAATRGGRRSFGPRGRRSATAPRRPPTGSIRTRRPCGSACPSSVPDRGKGRGATPRHRTRSRCRPPVPPSRDGTRRWPPTSPTTPCRNRRSGRDRRDRRPAAAPTTVRRHPRRSPPLPARTRARHRRGARRLEAWCSRPCGPGWTRSTPPSTSSPTVRSSP